jgi:hypothetical protein
MKKQFTILKDKPQINIKMTRDSVCAADDFDAPHEKNMSTYSFVDPVVLTSHLSSGYLPRVSGVGHTWDCVLNGKVIATVAVDNIKAKSREVVYAENNHIHFVYHSATY